VFIINLNGMKKNFLQKMLCPLLILLGILIWATVDNANVWEPFEWTVACVLFVGIVLLALWASAANTKSKLDSWEKIFVFLFIGSFALFVCFLFLAEVVHIRLALTLLFVCMAILQVFDYIENPPKKFQKAVLFTDAIVALFALMLVCSYFANSDELLFILWLIICVCVVCLFLTVIGYAIKRIWQKFKKN